MIILRFAIEPIEEMTLSYYPATTLRGGLGYCLKQKLCIYDVKTCNQKCQNPSECSYTKAFEEQVGALIDSHYVSYARPYIIRTNKNYKNHYRQGEVFEFDLLLFGDMIKDYMSYIGAMIRFGEKGIGKNSEKFTVKWIKSIDATAEKIIFEYNQLLSKPSVLSFNEIYSEPKELPKKLKIEFISPARVKFDGQYLYEISFELFVQNLVRRLKSMLYFHHDYILDNELAEFFIDAAIDVETVHSEWNFESIGRFSTRQKQKMNLNGVVGEMIVEGESLQRLYPLLYLGQFLHIGKQSAFGFGQYRLSIY